MIGKYIGVAVAAGLVATAPCQANDFYRDAGATQPAAFGGVTLRVPLGQKSGARPEARLQLTTYASQRYESGSLRKFSTAGLELGASRKGKPLLFVGGQNTADVQQKLGLDKTTTLLIVGGVVVVLVVIALASSGGGFGDTCPTVDGSRDHCTNP